MTAASVLTVSPASLAGDDAAGRLVARALLGDGVPVAARQVVDEAEGALDRALSASVEGGGLVVVMAPPGGSAGDIVRRALARLAGVRLVLNDGLHAALERDYARRGQAMPHRLDRLALLPQGAELWLAPAGEPGWAMTVKGAVAAVLPAASAHLASLVSERLIPLARGRAGEATAARTLLTAGLAPSDAEERLAPWLGRPGPVAVSSAVVDGDVWVRLLARGVSRAAAADALARAERDVAGALGDDCYGADGDSLEAALGRLLAARGLTVSAAESCTGGLVAERLTGVRGASRYFERGAVAYSSGAIAALGVPAPLIEAHGAVSAEVARAMASGIRRITGSACAVAVTGVAGPGGGTPDKPVGTVFAAVLAPGGEAVRRFVFPGSRDEVRRRASQCALDMLRRALLAGPPAGAGAEGNRGA